jgi:hypothetical protein
MNIVWIINGMIIHERNPKRVDKNLPIAAVSTIHLTCSAPGDRNQGFAGKNQLLSA